MYKLLDFESQRRNQGLILELFTAMVARSKLLQTKSTALNLEYDRLHDENALLKKQNL